MECSIEKEHGLELGIEQYQLNSENQYDISIVNRGTDRFDTIELPDELGELEFKNFLYKR